MMARAGARTVDSAELGVHLVDLGQLLVHLGFQHPAALRRVPTWSSLRLAAACFVEGLGLVDFQLPACRSSSSSTCVSSVAARLLGRSIGGLVLVVLGGRDHPLAEERATARSSSSSASLASASAAW